MRTTTTKMADGERVDSFLRELPSLVKQANRHLHCENVNILENMRRRLDDNYVAVRTILQHCMGQEDCDDLNPLLREIHDRLLRLLEQYNTLCNCSLDGDEPLQPNVGYRFVTQEQSAQGRRRLEIDEVSLNELHNIKFTMLGVRLPVKLVFHMEQFYGGGTSLVYRLPTGSFQGTLIQTSPMMISAVWSERFCKICQMQGRP